MTPSPPVLPTNRAFLVQFRAQPPGTPMAWEGRVEHVVSGQVTHVHTLAPWRSPPSSLPEGRCSRW